MALDPYLAVIILAMLPTIEALGAITVGILVFGLNPAAVFALAFFFNTAVYFPIFGLLDKFYPRIRRISLIRRFVEGAHHKGHRQVEKYGYFGLTIFLALPIPFSGTWTGTLIAWLLGLDKKKAFVAVMVGVFVACLTALLLSLFAQEVLYALGAPRVSPI